MCQILFICSQYTVKITQKTSLIWNSETTQNLNIYLYNYQTETAIFLATKHEKIIVACSYLNFYKYFLHFELLASSTTKNEIIHVREYINTENISKQQETVADVRNCLVKMTLRLFQPISVIMNMVPTILGQFKRLAQGGWSSTSTH